VLRLALGIGMAIVLRIQNSTKNLLFLVFHYHGVCAVADGDDAKLNPTPVPETAA